MCLQFWAKTARSQIETYWCVFAILSKYWDKWQQGTAIWLQNAKVANITRLHHALSSLYKTGATVFSRPNAAFGWVSASKRNNKLFYTVWSVSSRNCPQEHGNALACSCKFDQRLGKTAVTWKHKTSNITPFAACGGVLSKNCAQHG
jgi:hypothetical protein